jgi:hypothetical protein
LIFIFDLEYLIRVQSAEPLHAKMNPTSCLFGSRFAYIWNPVFLLAGALFSHQDYSKVPALITVDGSVGTVYSTLA